MKQEIIKRYSAIAEYIGNKKQWWLFGIAVSIPILVYNIGLLASGDKIIPGDLDYHTQLYEAFRRSVLEFQQFPGWNPWIAGGIPLFANVQFGLVSIQSLLVLLFGSVMGIKVAVVIYQLIGFFGFRQLFKSGFQTSPFRAICLAYIPIFGSFFVYRTIAGHFTFLLIAFVPWLILFYLKRSEHRYGWLAFALIYSLMVWSSPHYITIMSMAVIAIWFLYEILFRFVKTVRDSAWSTFFRKLKVDSAFFVKAGTVIVLLCAYRMYFVFDFLKDYPRLEEASDEPYTTISRGLYAIWGPDQYGSPPHLAAGWGWTEASTYIGIGTAFCLLIILFVSVKHLIAKKKLPFTYPILLLTALFVTFFALGMADFGPYSPFNLLNHLPVFDSMRVATRWLLWSSLCALFILAAYKSKRFGKTINAILFVTVIELFIAGSAIVGGAFFLKVEQYRPPQASFNQEYLYRIPRPAYNNDAAFKTVYAYDENLLETTRNNHGQVIAGDALVDTRQENTTTRCGENRGNCPFISGNAQITYWSPNKLVVERLAPGKITINMNPGKGWRVNGKYTFNDKKITEPKMSFVIEDTSHTIVLDYAPMLSPAWLRHQIGL